MNEGAFLIDYPLNKHFDVYSGVSYSVNAGGLSSGYLNNNMTTFASGFRLSSLILGSRPRRLSYSRLSVVLMGSLAVSG